MRMTGKLAHNKSSWYSARRWCRLWLKRNQISSKRPISNLKIPPSSPRYQRRKRGRKLQMGWLWEQLRSLVLQRIHWVLSPRSAASSTRLLTADEIVIWRVWSRITRSEFTRLWWSPSLRFEIIQDSSKGDQPLSTYPCWWVSSKLPSVLNI
jgi:hypothetical protein